MKEERRKKGQEIAREIIARYIIEELGESTEEYGIITVTQAVISQDMSYLDAYVSCLKNTESLTKFLAASARDIEKILCKKLAIMKITRIRFRYDHQGKNSADIYEKIKTLKH